MANILLVDPAEIARKALHGILARGNHRLVGVSTALEAWDFVRRNVKVDLVFVELMLEGGDGGLAFIQRLRNDAYLKLLPVVVYTSTGNREAVHRALELKVQNFLVKPYHDDSIFAEIAKALTNPWRNRHFEEEKSFCAMMGLTPAALRQQLDILRTAVQSARPVLVEFARKQDDKGAVGRMEELMASAEAAGAWGLVECLTLLRGKAENAEWPEFLNTLDGLDFADRLIACQLNPGLIPEEFLSHDESNTKETAATRAMWFDAPAQNRCPVVTWAQLERQLDTLAGCPVIDSVAAAFRMAATGQPSSLMPLMDQAEKDPGLAAQLLIAANHVRRHEEKDTEPVENPRLSIGLLGEIRLGSLARSLVTVEERLMNLPPCTWPHFWMFQIGVARMARYTCSYLEFHNLEARAYTAGLLHDIGQLLLLQLHPHGFAAVLDYARQHSLPLAVVEKKFLGCTTQEMAAHFAEKQGLPPCYCQVMRWLADPAQAGEDAELVAIVSLARDLCLQNHVGFIGDTPRKYELLLGDTSVWQILSRSVFPSFDLKKFEAEAHAECRALRQELHGRLSPACA